MPPRPVRSVSCRNARGTRWIEGWVGPRAEKTVKPAGNRTPVAPRRVQPLCTYGRFVVTLRSGRSCHARDNGAISRMTSHGGLGGGRLVIAMTASVVRAPSWVAVSTAEDADSSLIPFFAERDPAAKCSRRVTVGWTWLAVFFSVP
jgi:hypothetical protein